VSKQSKRSQRLARAFRLQKSLYPAFPDPKNWEDDKVWIEETRQAFDVSEISAQEAELFRKFRLNPRNPHHWRRLVSIYASIEVGDKSAGRPPKWSSAELCRLLKRIAELQRCKPSSKLSDIYRALTSRKGAYAGKTVSQLRYAHGLARDPVKT